MDVKQLKEFLRIDGDDMDAMLQQYQLAAEEYLANAGVAKNYGRALYTVAVTVIVGVFIENPSLLATWRVEEGKVGVTITGIIAQLRATQVAS